MQAQQFSRPEIKQIAEHGSLKFQICALRKEMADKHALIRRTLDTINKKQDKFRWKHNRFIAPASSIRTFKHKYQQAQKRRSEKAQQAQQQLEQFLGGVAPVHINNGLIVGVNNGIILH